MLIPAVLLFARPAAATAASEASLSLTVGAPTTQCAQSSIQWSGGTAPYTLSIVRVFSDREESLRALCDTCTQTSLNWTVDLPAGLVSFKLEDAAGHTVYSDPWSVHASDAAECSAPSTFAPTATSYYPTETASSIAAQTSEKKGGAPPTGVIVGAIVGVLLGLVTLGLLLLFCRSWRRRAKKTSGDTFAKSEKSEPAPQYHYRKTRDCVSRSSTVEPYGTARSISVSVPFVGEFGELPLPATPGSASSATTPGVYPSAGLYAPVPGHSPSASLGAYSPSPGSYPRSLSPIPGRSPSPSRYSPSPSFSAGYPSSPSPSPTPLPAQDRTHPSRLALTRSRSLASEHHSVVSVGDGAARPYPTPSPPPTISHRVAPLGTPSMIFRDSYFEGAESIVSPIMPEMSLGLGSGSESGMRSGMGLGVGSLAAMGGAPRIIAPLEPLSPLPAISVSPVPSPRARRGVDSGECGRDGHGAGPRPPPRGTWRDVSSVAEHEDGSELPYAFADVDIIYDGYHRT